MNDNQMHHGGGSFEFEQCLGLGVLFVIGIYIFAGVLSNRHHKIWPLYRYFFWIIGVVCAAAAVMGPIAHRAHTDFVWHMLGHLLLGMMAPILIALSAPMTLCLRMLSVKNGRRLTGFFKSRLIGFLSHPIIAALLNFGGLWVLYTTDLYTMMQQNILLHILVHFHVFTACYLFTISMIYIDPSPHRFSFTFRSIVLILSLASHAILSKYIYAHPPNNVPLEQAETGAMLMYYGGDAVDLVLITLLCYQWYKAARPRTFWEMAQS